MPYPIILNVYNPILQQISLLLEFCSKGDINSYLCQYRQEFRHSLSVFDERKIISELTTSSKGAVPHDIRLLYRWTYQVSFISKV